MTSSTKPIPCVTYSGDVHLFKALETVIVQGLPQETVEWKRSYGRPSRAVTLSASFLPFKIESEGSNQHSKTVKKLTGCQVLHTYWVECPDVDIYKATVRENIQSWFNQLKFAECPDWLVILVESADSKKNNKILPRTTVLDKIKNDFGGKTAERCLAVTGPAKGETKISDSLQTFLFRLRQALMAAFSRTLTKFEETVRTQRERRNDANWNFCNYFLLQEELAFVFEMLGMYDEALVQYDELDALFTQFVLNSAVGEAPGWLSSFQASPNDWSGVCLDPKKKFNALIREKIQSRTMSVIDFRNYLFARQATLLLVASKPAEVARRCLSYVQGCAYEIKLLNVNVVDGAVPTWILLTNLQVLSTCQSSLSSSSVTSSHTAMESFALLWNVSKDKLYELGKKCGLLPGANVGSSELHCVVTLSSGITDEVEEGDIHPSPADKLKEALSSGTAFTKLYLELSELAMGTFKHCGRLRSARLIGRDLSRFYLQLNEPQKSTSFLLDLLRGYQEENWPRLKVDTHVELAEVYLKTGDHDKFIEASASIAAYECLEVETRLKYFNHLIQSAKDRFRSIPCVGMMDLTSIKIHFDTNLESSNSVLCETLLKVDIEIVSHFPGPVKCDQISVTVQPVRITTEQQQPAKSGLNKKTSESIVEVPEKDVKRLSLSSMVPIKAQNHMKQDGSISSVALVCPNVHQLLGRKVSHGLLPAETSITKKDFTHTLTTKSVTISPGTNRFTLEMMADTEGVFALSQFVAQSQQLEFIQNVSCTVPNVTVIRVAPTVTIIKTRDDLLAGTEQEVDLVIRAGSRAFDKEMNLRLSTSRGLLVRLSSTGTNLLQREMDLVLRAMTAFETVTFRLVIMADLSFTSSKESTSVEHKLTLQCPWLTKIPPVMDLALHISAPFSVSYKLQTANTKKFVNIHVQGLTALNRTFEFKDPGVQLPDATFKNPILSKLEWKSLNQSDQITKISSELSANYLWELRGIPAQDDSLPVLKAEFTALYRMAGTKEWEKFSFNFDIIDYATLFTVRSRVDPVKGNDFLRAGSLCHMTLTVNDMLPKASSTAALMYEVLADQALWAVCGRTAGVFSMEGAPKHSVTLDVMPLVCGYLPLPAVRLSRYIPADHKPKDGGNRKPDLGMSPSALPRVEPFSPGQVYNWSKAQQVHVLAAPSTGGGPTSLDSSMS